MIDVHYQIEISRLSTDYFSGLSFLNLSSNDLTFNMKAVTNTRVVITIWNSARNASIPVAEVTLAMVSVFSDIVQDTFDRFKGLLVLLCVGNLGDEVPSQ